MSQETLAGSVDCRESEPPKDVAFEFADTPARWFIRGTAVGMLVMASINALSYFFRSADWSSLVGKPKSREESIGFPFEVWEAGNSYGGMFADYPMLGLNILVAALVGSIVGWITARNTDFLNGLIRGMHLEKKKPQPVQFTLRDLMIATAMAAVVATIARYFAAQSQTLIAIYALGPALLVAIVMVPRHLTWQKRVALIIPATVTLIAAAIAVGTAIGMEFDKVLMGIFLCWTPQSALAAIVLTASLLYIQVRKSSGLVLNQD